MAETSTPNENFILNTPYVLFLFLNKSMRLFLYAYYFSTNHCLFASFPSDLDDAAAATARLLKKRTF